MQGEHPLPKPVVEKFSKTGGALSKNVFLLRKFATHATEYPSDFNHRVSQTSLVS